MDLGLKHKIALVTASSKGLGQAIAMSLAREGARVGLCARNKEELEATADRICQDTDADLFTKTCDVSNAQQIKEFVDAAAAYFGGVDILVTNTGGPPVGTFHDLDDATWENAGNLLLMSAIRLIRQVTPYMEARGGGRIINITSISVKEPIAGLMLSNAYRAAIIGMAKTLATELAPKRILVNNVCPGKISTDRLVHLDAARAARAGLSVEEVRAEAQRHIPLGRYGQPEELAALVTFLASSQASYITGSTILCDGGLHKGLM